MKEKIIKKSYPVRHAEFYGELDFTKFHPAGRHNVVIPSWISEFRIVYIFLFI